MLVWKIPPFSGTGAKHIPPATNEKTAIIHVHLLGRDARNGVHIVVSHVCARREKREREQRWIRAKWHRDGRWIPKLATALRRVACTYKHLEEKESENNRL